MSAPAASPWPTPLASAKALVGAHPALVALDPAAAPVVAEAIDNAAGLSTLATAISKQGPATPTGGWATLREVGTVTQPATEYVPSTATLQAATPVLAAVLQATQDDSRLEGILWFAHPARTGGYRPVTPQAPFTWEVEGMPGRFGVLAPSVAFDAAAGDWRVRLGNTAPRFAAVYVEFLDAKGSPLKPAGWVSRLPAGVEAGFETATVKYLALLSPTRRIEGIPMPEADLTVDFRQPAGTAEVRLSFGGLGAEPWNAVAGPLGAIATAVLGYAVPAILGFTGVSPDGWYPALTASPPVLSEVLQAGAFLRSATGTADAYRLLAEKIGPLVHGGGLPLLTAALLEHVAAPELAAAAAVVNWAAATLALTTAPAAPFSSSVLGSPADFALRLSPSLVGTLRVEIRPAPASGSWPATATGYTVEGRWDGGRATAQGKVDGIATPSPVVALLDAVPANRDVTVGVTVTNAAGQTLTGATALSNATAAAQRSVALTLGEVQTPIGSSRYAFALTLAYSQARGHHWTDGPRPAATRKDLDSGGRGHNLAALVGLELGAEGRLLGYAWQASGQSLPFCGSSQPTEGQIHAFQTLGALATPEQGLAFPSCGFSAQPFLAFGPSALGFDGWLDPRPGFQRLRRFVPGKPFDMSSQAPGYGRFNAPHLDDLAIHPAGLALAVSFRDNTLEVLQIGSGAAGAAEPVAGITGGPGTAAGRFGGPVALALTPGRDLLVLESLNRRLQAVDPFGNPIPYFPGDQALLPLRAESAPVTYLDLAVGRDGKIFVLLYLNQGDAVADYRLDLYAADGKYLGGTPGVNAARIAIDSSDNVYTLDYSHLLGPGGRTEPGLSVWIPQPS
jgi:hypothetical protein